MYFNVYLLVFIVSYSNLRVHFQYSNTERPNSKSLNSNPFPIILDTGN
jgi:hypothetical protein